MLNARNRGVVHPAWLLPLLGERERRISDAVDVQVLCVDKDDERLPPHQRLIESADLGESFVVDSLHRQICR
jgi:hypothetical protein